MDQASARGTTRPVSNFALRIPPESIKTELADDGRPAPAAHPGDCCGLPPWAQLGRRAGPNGRKLTNLGGVLCGKRHGIDRYMAYKSGFGAKEVPRAEFLALFRAARDSPDPGLGVGLDGESGWAVAELIKGVSP